MRFDSNNHNPAFAERGDVTGNHLPNRRDWLIRTGAGAAAFGFARCAVPQVESRKPISLAVVSDTHIGYKDNDGAKNSWTKTAAELADSEAPFLLHLGDVIDGGRVEQYPVYREIREMISRPVYEIPGNHDPVEAFQKHLRRDIDTVVDHQWLRVILLNNAKRDSHDGFFDDEQLTWLDRRLNEAARDDRIAIVCCHVPVHQNRHPDRGWYVKPEHGQQRFYEIMASHESTGVAVLHGHFHNGIRGWNDHGTLHEICLPSVLYNLNRGLEAQKAPGYNPLEFRPGYTLLTIGGGELTLQYKPSGESPAVVKQLKTS